jgi:hypothetical protein
MTEQVDGHEAYRDDAEYTAPEMQPGNGETLTAEPDTELGVVTGAGMTIGSAGGALAGEVLVDEVEEEKAEMSLNPDPEA